MPNEVSVDLKARDQMSGVLDHVAQRFGIATTQGLAMGVAFAGINISVQLLQQAFSSVIQYVQDGIDANRKFELSMARLSVSSTEFSGSMDGTKQSLMNFSVIFGTDLDTLTTGLQTFIREGYNAADSTTLLYETEMLAVTSGNDLATTQDTIIRAMHEFNLGAGDVTDVITKLNGITSVTGMSLSDIDTVLGRVAEAAQKSGISFDDLINLMYTLHETGTSNRFMASELTKELGDLGNVKIEPMPDSTATSIDTKYKKIAGTVQFTKDQVTQLNKAFQMRVTEGLDIGAYLDKGTIAIARQLATAQELGKTLPDAYTSLQRAAEASPIGAGLFGQRVSDIEAMANAYQELDYETGQTGKDVKVSLDDIAKGIDDLNDKLNTQIATLETENQKLGDLTEMKQFTIDTRTATLAVQAQQDAIKELQRISDAYALSQMENNLAILKIQYGADTRHGLNRDEQQKIKDLEHLNMGLQIKEQENQIAIAKIQQNGLQDAQDALDSIRRTHDTAIYNQQIRDMTANITAESKIRDSEVADIAATNKELAIQQAAWQENQLVITTHWAKEMHDQLDYAYGNSGGGYSNPAEAQAQKSASNTPTPPEYHGTIPFWKYQHGGIVPETAPALLHKGEVVIPKDMVDAMSRNRPQPLPKMSVGDAQPNTIVVDNGGGNCSCKQDISIIVHADLSKDVDVEEWGKQLGAGLASGFLETSSSAVSSVTTHKGTTANVPGTTTTIRTGRVPGNSLVVPQIIKNKPRFRVG